MPECDYCGDSFEGDHAYLEHLRAEHEGELGSIDRRRIEEELETTDSDGFPTGPVVLGIVLAVAIAIVGYVIFVHGAGSGGESGAVNDISVAQLPGQPTESAHGHGLVNVTIDGQELDFSQSRFQRPREYAAFHFEGGDGRVWHKHAPGVTLEYAMATLGIDVSEDSVTFDGTTYRDSDAGTNVTVTVNGEAVDPEQYELSGASDQNPQQGDFVRIFVTTEG
jgi:hypothetical protein